MEWPWGEARHPSPVTVAAGEGAGQIRKFGAQELCPHVVGILWEKGGNAILEIITHVDKRR